MGDARYDAERLATNERSLEWATNQGCPWNDADDVVILERWLLVPHETREEEAVSRILGRSIEACRGRAEALRKVLGVNGHSVRKSVEEPEICDQCWMAKTPSGTCGCDE